MSYQDINTEVSNRIGYITLDREEKRNALGPRMIKELKEAFMDMGDNINIKVSDIDAKGLGNVHVAFECPGHLQMLDTA